MFTKTKFYHKQLFLQFLVLLHLNIHTKAEGLKITEK